jgi:flavin reductase (DIM6/NTAB) family NADH-FMN oxidoreductase RutF
MYIAPQTKQASAEERLMTVDPATFKETLAHWASGVTVLTTVGESGPVGITASSFTSLSINPPQVLVSVNKRLYTHDAIRQSGVFAVSILHDGQEEVGKRFAGMVPEIEDRFAGLALHVADTGSPILSDALAWVDCSVQHVYDGDDHTIFVGQVLAAGVGPQGNNGAPLLYYNRGWRRLAQQGQT